MVHVNPGVILAIKGITLNFSKDSGITADLEALKLDVQ